MKVYIGPYTNWIGPYQIADKVFFWLDKYPTDEQLTRVDYRLHDWLGTWLATGPDGKKDSRLMRFCNWVNEHKKRTVYVKIDKYDYWSADHTMALIIVPLLKALKEHKQGSPLVELSDVPDNLWPSALPGASNNYNDDTIHERWKWVLDEMIWAFEQETKDNDEDEFYDHSNANNPDDDLMVQVGKIKVDHAGLEAHQDRKQNGFRLFGKYYQGLWD